MHDEPRSPTIDLPPDLPPRTETEARHWVERVVSFVAGLAGDLGHDWPHVRVVLTEHFDKAVRAARGDAPNATVTRERVGGRVTGITIYDEDVGATVVVEASVERLSNPLGLVFACWLLAHELGHVMTVHAHATLGIRDVAGLVEDSSVPPGAGLLALDALDEFRADLIAAVWLRQVRVGGDLAVDEMTPAFFFGDYDYAEVVELLPVTTTDVLEVVTNYRLRRIPLEDMWETVRQHFREVLILHAHARAYAAQDGTDTVLTSAAFTDDPVGRRLDQTWHAIVNATQPDGPVPPTESFAEVQRRVAVQGGRAVNDLYGIVGVRPRQNPDGSLFIEVGEPDEPDARAA